MAKTSNEPLKPNPYFTYRDPETGVWRVIEGNSSSPSSANLNNTQSKNAQVS